MVAFCAWYVAMYIGLVAVYLVLAIWLATTCCALAIVTAIMATFGSTMYVIISTLVSTSSTVAIIASTLIVSGVQTVLFQGRVKPK